jgi:hypothetical protein
MLPAMLNNLETEERRSDPAIANTITPLLDPDTSSGARGQPRQDHPEPSRTKPQCLWCGRAFAPRTTGGSPQRFCSTGHRQAFWVAARRWIMRAVQANLLSVESLKASQSSVHAAREAFQDEGSP